MCIRPSQTTPYLHLIQFARVNIPIPFVSVGCPGNGDGVNYAYQWQKEDGSGIFQDADGINDQTGYVPPAGLDVDYDFRRVVTSGACVDTLAELRVEVFAPISGNLIADNDTICFNTMPDLIIQDPELVLDGGDPDPTNWRYRWESCSGRCRTLGGSSGCSESGIPAWKSDCHYLVSEGSAFGQ